MKNIIKSIVHLVRGFWQLDGAYDWFSLTNCAVECAPVERDN